jgi:hypothetical protein
MVTRPFGTSFSTSFELDCCTTFRTSDTGTSEINSVDSHLGWYDQYGFVTPGFRGGLEAFSLFGIWGSFRDDAVIRNVAY